MFFNDVTLVRGYDKPHDADGGEYNGGEYNEFGFSASDSGESGVTPSASGALLLPSKAPSGTRQFVLGVVLGVVLVKWFKLF